VAASPAPPPDGAPTRPGSLADWLRERDDRQLARLLRLRPDLALPSPPDLGALAGRVAVRTSTQRAVDSLDAFTLGALERLVLLADESGPLDDAVDDPPADALEALLDRALIWGDEQRVQLVPTVRDAVGPYPTGLGRPAATLFAAVPDVVLVPVLKNLGLPPSPQPRAGQAIATVLADPERIAELVAAGDDAEREVLARLAAGPPVGTVRHTRLAAEEAAHSPPHRLLNRGLIVPLDSQRVELPREVGRFVRARSSEPSSGPEPPELELTRREPDALDRLGTTAVLETLRLIDALADSWTAQPPALLRSGGLGVRELRRTARDLGVDEPAAALVAEVAYAAALINSTNGPEPVFLPSTEYDNWRGHEPASRWLVLAQAWLGMTRQPSLVNQRGERDRVISALGPDAERGTIPALRRQVLGTLEELPPGAAPASREGVLDRLGWHQPRRASGQRPLAEAILAEADVLGLTAAGGLTGYGRTLLAATNPAANGVAGQTLAAAEHALARALPEPVDHFLVQPDLTVVVPGPPLPAMGRELALLADLESTGGASVYRITERTVRRALDAGRSGERLAEFIRTHSRTPLPQALTYLIEDSSRRHGVLRAGSAAAYLRCDDEALLARVLADRHVDALGLRGIAPTVAIADVPVARLLDGLRTAGYSPAAEAAGGALVTIGVDPPRAPTRPPARTISTRGAADTDAQLAELVRRMRSGDALAEVGRRIQPIAAQVPGVTSAATMELLRRAVREELLIWLGVAEPDGTATAHELRPISLAAGYVRGWEEGNDKLVAFPVHRITAVRVLDDPDD